MSSTDQRKRRVTIVVATIFFALALLALQILRRNAEPVPEPKPFPLGTNELKIGAKLYNPHAGTNHVFTVTDLNQAYDFPDEDTRPGVKIKSVVNGASSWVPRENMNKMLVVQ